MTLTPSSLALALLATLGASVPVTESSGVKDADDRMVAECKYLGDVQGSSGWGNLASAHGMENAKKGGRKRAEKLGATHVVWSTVVGGYTSSASGRAYKCDASQDVNATPAH